MNVFIGRVRYIDHDSETHRIPHEPNLFAPFLCKSARLYSHENEVRAVYWDIPTGAVIMGREKPPLGHFVPVDLTKLVQAIVISPLTPPEFESKVRRL